MKQASLPYRAVVAAAIPFVPLLLRDPRQRAAHAARIAAPSRLAAWARERRDPTRPLVWFHAPSVGEGLQARAVIQALRSRLPDVQLVYTHFSPSAVAFAATIAADWSGYLCYDRRADVERMLTAAAPDLFVFTKLDLWPTLAVRASARGTRVAMVAATVSAASGRLRWPVRRLTMPGYAALDLTVAASAEDVARLARLGCPYHRIVIGGDPRVDSVLQAVGDAAPPLEGTDGLNTSVTLIAGSTWSDDEAVVLAAFATVRRSHPKARLVIAPHEPTADHLQAVEATARRAGLPEPIRLSRAPANGDPAIILVDRTGVLARLYARGMAAYVGGGWGRQGIHSVLEPAASARAVVIGPRDRGNRDARMLEAAGALTRLPESAAAARLALIWRNWLESPDTAVGAGRAARGALDAERGAAARTADLLARLMTTARIPVRG